MPLKKKQPLSSAEGEIFDYQRTHEEKVSTEEKLNADLTIDSVKQTGQLSKAEISQNGIIVGDLWGYITDVNDAVVKVFGAKDKSDFVGKHLLTFVAKGERGRITKKSFDSIAQGEGYTERHRITTKEGQEILLEVKVNLIKDKQGEKIGFIDLVRILPS
jgi:PAS domain S-box-containing protein